MSSEPQWFKSSYSAQQGDCVEVAYLDEATTGVRDSKNPDAGILSFPASSWAGFVSALGAGEFDPA